ncbi:hypothetical protein THF1C08_10463 [Vibrio jasicida]|uniref:Uncharacterized protein n=1 Tax=Vibrio jasicida TaxID=766224 RepID=A0AAU9QFI5_9VIBR|nr:hypothetical protein THF1C08_10463 [Vibrio jasicida]CAH1566271.1 hypothetical protein THF1A12_10464 [Vibrio jasicida]
MQVTSHFTMFIKYIKNRTLYLIFNNLDKNQLISKGKFFNSIHKNRLIRHQKQTTV